MTRFVIDPPTLLHLVDAAVPVHPDHQLVAPGAIRSQALQLLYDDVRAGRRTEKDARRDHTRLTELKMRLLNDRVSRWVSWQIASEHGWDSLRDGEYLAVAKLQADALATVDADLAAKAEGIVPVKPVEALSRA